MHETNLFYQSDYWNNFPKEDIDVVAKDLHPSWDAENQSYKDITKIDDKALEIIGENRSRALDFGVGMGRNYPYLKSIFQEVHGFDTEIMISNIKKRELKTDLLTSNWNDVFYSGGYNLVYECTVFQHMPPQEVLHRLYFLSQISERLYMTTRVYNDFFRSAGKGGVNMFKLVDSTNCFDLEYINIDLEKAKNLMDESHYAMLLKSRNF